MRAIRNVFRRKLRAFLTIFGITIGVIALVVMGAMAEKLQLLVDGGVDYYEDKVIVTAPSAMAGFGTEPLSLDLVEDIEAIDGVTRVSAQVQALLDDEPSAVNFGVPPNINAEDGRQEGYETFVSDVAQGRELEPDDRGKVVVGSDLVAQLDAEVGGTVEVRGGEYEVVGILGRTLTAPDKAVVMSFADAQDIIVADLPVAIRDQVDPRDLATSFAVYVEEDADPDEMADVIEAEVADVQAMGPTSFVESVKEPLEIFNQIIYAVELLSLFIRGLSVVNTMTMSVAERTREIGIRKAIGATDTDIMSQFVVESAIMGLTGGLIGLGLGAVIVAGANAAGAATSNELFLITPRLAVGTVAFSLVLGVLAGLLPARYAARLNPVAALRYE
jgi:putative ABC transport system permease protein